MARDQVPDTSVFIHLIHRRIQPTELFELAGGGRAWLSSVVVAELYGGARSLEERREIQRLARAMRGVQRLLTPTAEEWERAGLLIERRSRLQGILSPRDHLADVLILVSAARQKGVVVTRNLRHFEAWVRLARASGLDVAISPYPD